jgi:hypothetical protein
VNHCVWTRSNSRLRFVTDVSIFAVAVPFLFNLQLPFWCFQCELKMNLLPRYCQDHTVAYSGTQPRGSVQSEVDYQLCLRTRGVGLCQSYDVERVPDAGGVVNLGGKENSFKGGKKGYISSSFCMYIVQPALLVNEHKCPRLHCAQQPGTS